MDAINTNNKELGLISHAMYNMEKTLNATVQLEQYNAKAIELLAQHVAENSKNIQLLEKISPQQAWTITFVHSKITPAGDRLEKIIHSWKKGKVSHELVELFNMSSVIDFDEEATAARGCTVSETGIVNVRFDILTRDPSSLIPQADPFAIWTNLTGAPCLEEYSGSPYMVYNLTSDCRAEMQVMPFEQYVSYQCAEEHYQADFNQRRHVGCLGANEVVSPRIQYKVTSQKIFIYCYGTNITIKEANGSFQCPPYVFSLPPNLSWRAYNVGYEASAGHISTSLDHDLVPMQFLPSKENRQDPLLEALAKVKQLERRLSEAAAYIPDSAAMIHNATLVHVKRMSDHMSTLESIILAMKYGVIILLLILLFKPLKLVVNLLKHCVTKDRIAREDELNMPPIGNNY